MKNLLWIIISLLALVGLLLLIPFTRQFFYKQFTRKVLYKNTVPLIAYQEIDTEKDLILDTRDTAEFVISHIPNAQFVGFENFDAQSVADIPKDQKIVLYCSVGYRSERIGEQLQELGFTNVHNLDGGIFTWVNKKQGVQKMDKTITKEVHPYSKNWGFWLTRGKKVL